MIEALALVCLLGSNDFKIRERAHHLLAQNSTEAIAAIRLGESFTDCEIRTRCRLLSQPWLNDNADRVAQRFRLPGWECGFPWIDTKDMTTNGEYLERAKPFKLHDGSPDWLNWCKATELLVGDWIRQRTPEIEIWLRLERFAVEHRRYCTANDLPTPPEFIIR